MIIAIMSDSHDHIWNLRKALRVLKGEHAGMIIHCGDFVAPFMLEELDSANIPVHGVFGNNDGDRYLLTKSSLTSLKNITLHGQFGQVDAGGYRIGFTHHRTIADGLVSSGTYRVVCYGHSHVFEKKQTGQSVLLNPGEIMGKDGSPGFCLVDTDSNEINRVELH